jgi:hypothetical protein
MAAAEQPPREQRAGIMRADNSPTRFAIEWSAAAVVSLVCLRQFLT